jgi:hypothetical protein
MFRGSIDSFSAASVHRDFAFGQGSPAYLWPN